MSKTQAGADRRMLEAKPQNLHLISPVFGTKSEAYRDEVAVAFGVAFILAILKTRLLENIFTFFLRFGKRVSGPRKTSS